MNDITTKVTLCHASNDMYTRNLTHSKLYDKLMISSYESISKIISFLLSGWVQFCQTSEVLIHHHFRATVKATKILDESISLIVIPIHCTSAAAIWFVIKSTNTSVRTVFSDKFCDWFKTANFRRFLVSTSMDLFKIILISQLPLS